MAIADRFDDIDKSRQCEWTRKELTVREDSYDVTVHAVFMRYNGGNKLRSVELLETI